MASRRWFTQTGWKLAAAAAAGGVGELVRRRRSARNVPPPPPAMTTQSSPGQIADLQQAYGADMAPQSVRPPAGGAGDE
jgi:hypothetical protein